jgi:hypothetical protein
MRPAEKPVAINPSPSPEIPALRNSNYRAPATSRLFQFCRHDEFAARGIILDMQKVGLATHLTVLDIALPPPGEFIH